MISRFSNIERWNLWNSILMNNKECRERRIHRKKNELSMSAGYFSKRSCYRVIDIDKANLFEFSAKNDGKFFFEKCARYYGGSIYFSQLKRGPRILRMNKTCDSSTVGRNHCAHISPLVGETPHFPTHLLQWKHHNTSCSFTVCREYKPIFRGERRLSVVWYPHSLGITFFHHSLHNILLW